MYEPHYKVTMSGTLGSGAEEIFSMGFALARHDQAPIGHILDPNDTVWTDIASDCTAWFSDPLTKIHAHAKLTKVKIASIGSNGRYASPPVERLVTASGGVTASTTRPANQEALVVTLHTAGDLNRIKGRFYLPLPALTTQGDGRFLAADVDGVETRTQTFINAVNNQPGLDVLGLSVHVASQGRRNKDGSVRVGPGNHLVTGISVGRVLDTQRRRRNKLLEARSIVPVQ